MGLLTGAFGLLALVILLGEIDLLTDERYSDVISVFSLVGFLGSGYLLLLFRHGFIPLKRATLWGALAAVVTTGALITIYPTPENTANFDAFDWIVLSSALIAWAACVGEPAYRFWRASRDRPVVQKARLRFLSTAYVTLILLVLFAVVAGSGGEDEPGVEVFTNAVALALVPILYASFAPPGWLRGVWRTREEESLRLAEDLAAFAPDLVTVAGRAVDRAIRLVGAEGGFVTASEKVLASVNIDTDEASRLGGAVESGDVTRRSEDVGGKRRHVVLISLDTSDKHHVLGLVLGPFTPLFGSDELARLSDYAAIVGVALDRVRLVEAVRQETARYEALLQSVSDVGEGFVITEAGRCVYANEAYCNMTGYTLEELQNLSSLLELSRPEDRPELIERMTQRIAGDEVSEHYESALVSKDGRIRWVEASVKMLATDEGPRIVSLVRDISERKEAEKALSKHNETVQLLQDIAVAANEATDVDEVLRLAVRAVCRYAAWPIGHVFMPADELADEFISTDIWCLESEGNYEPFKAATENTKVRVNGPFPAKALETTRPVWITDISEDGPSPRRDAALECDVKAAFAFPILSGKEVAGVLEFFSEDVIEPDEALLDVMGNIGTQLGRVAERQRIESFRNNFISNAAHELRTPVTPIVGYTTLLADRWVDMTDEDRNMITTTLRQQGNRLRTLVNSLLDFTRVQRGRFEVDLGPVNLGDVLVSVVQAVPPPENQSVHRADTDGVMVLADRARLEDMLVNLLVNAYRYGGDVISIESESTPEGVLVSVTDNGEGVSQDLVGGLFDPFTRGEGSADIGGSGLGLAIVRMLAKAQGGDVWYESSEGEGARFVIKLRPAPAPAGADAEVDS